MAKRIIAQNAGHAMAEALLIEGVSPLDAARRLNISAIVVDRINTRLLFACAATLALGGSTDDIHNEGNTTVLAAR